MYISIVYQYFGAIQVLRNAIWGWGVSAFKEKSVTKVRFNGISIARGWVGGISPGKKRYVTLELLLYRVTMYRADYLGIQIKSSILPGQSLMRSATKLRSLE